MPTVNLLPCVYNGSGSNESGVVEMTRTLPGCGGNSSSSFLSGEYFDQPSYQLTSGNGLGYRAWSLQCTMTPVLWGDQSASSAPNSGTMPYWEIDDWNGAMLANLSWGLTATGAPNITLNGTPLANQPGPATLSHWYGAARSNAWNGWLNIANFTQGGDHAHASQEVVITLAGFDNSTCSVSMVDTAGHSFSGNGTNSGDGAHPALVTFNGENGELGTGCGWQFDQINTGQLITFGYMYE